MTKCCPTCGQPVLDLPENLPRLTPIQTTLFDTIRKAGTHGVSMSRLYNAIYGRHARQSRCIKEHVYNLRQKLKGTGIEIESWGWGRHEGYEATYRMVQK